MKRVLAISSCLSLILLLMVACSPEPAEQVEENLDRTPDWYLNPPEDNNEFLHAVSSGISSRRELARQKAEANARTNLSQKLEVKVEALEKIFTEEVTSGTDSNFRESFTNASKSVTSQTLTGVSTDRMEFAATEDGRYECFVVVRLPVGDARKALNNALSQEEEMYVKFKESKAFEELQQDLSRLGNGGSSSSSSQEE